MSPRRTDLFTTDMAGKPYAVRHGAIEIHTDDGARGWLPVAATDTARVIGEGVQMIIGEMAAGRVAMAPPQSAHYVPTDEQRMTSPVCAALATRGATERDVIEHLFRENVRLRKEYERALAGGLPPVYLGVGNGWPK